MRRFQGRRGSERVIPWEVAELSRRRGGEVDPVTTDSSHSCDDEIASPSGACRKIYECDQTPALGNTVGSSSRSTSPGTSTEKAASPFPSRRERRSPWDGR